VTNAVIAGETQLAAFFGAPEDGPFVMVNLLKFKPQAEYPDGSDSISPERPPMRGMGRP
jgi:hypothetical protein